MAEGDQAVQVKDSFWILVGQPGLEWHHMGVNQFAALFSRLLGQRDQCFIVCASPSKQDSSLLEQLPKSSYAISIVVPMPLDAVFRDLPILRVDVSTREDMCRREGGRCLHTVKE